MGPEASKPDFVETLKEALKYAKSVPGILSALPGLVTAIDANTNLFGISSAIKPEVYVFALGWVGFGFIAQPSNYINVRNNSDEFKAMKRRANIALVLFFLAACGYWLGTSYFEIHVPSSALAERAILLGLAFLAAASVEELTRAFVIHGLRIYIQKYRP